MYLVILTNLILVLLASNQIEASAICQTRGDPHYRTWDGAGVSYQGLCRHLMAGVCGTTNLQHWTVISNNIILPPFASTVSSSEYVEVTVYRKVIRMDAYGAIRVNGRIITRNTYLVKNRKIVVTRKFGRLTLTTDFGLIVRQRGFMSSIIAPAVYAGNVCGICGDWNGDWANDLGRDLSVFQQPESIGKPECSILVGNPLVGCASGTRTIAETRCRALYTESSFAACDGLTRSPIEDFIAGCVMDICGGGDSTVVSCDGSDALVELCEGLTDTRITNPPPECDDDEINGDPHFIVTSHDQYHTKLCYDVNGNDGDVLLVIRDEENDLEINGEIYGTKDVKHPKAYFSNFAIFYKDVKIVIDRNDITINTNVSFHWAESFHVPLDADMEYFVTSESRFVIEVELASDIQLRVTRTQHKEDDYYLGIMLVRTDGLGYHTTGVMGSFLKSSFNVVPSANSTNMLEFLDRSLSIPVQKVERRSRISPSGKVDCWHYSVKTDEIHDDLLGNRESYTVPTLEYKPF